MPVLAVEDVAARCLQGGSCRVDTEVKPGFKPGDVITAKNINPATHTRLPRYIRGKVGVIDRDHGVFVFPDTSAEMQGEKPQHCYSVKFSFQELWGSDAAETDALYIDLFEDYLLPGKGG